MQAHSLHLVTNISYTQTYLTYASVFVIFEGEKAHIFALPVFDNTFSVLAFG